MSLPILPNFQPIYPETPLDWRAHLTDQVVTDAKNIPTNNTIPPVLLGKASAAGALIETIYVIGMSATASAVRFWTRKKGDNLLYLETGTNTLQGVTRVTMGLNQLIPAGQTGWRLGPEEELYCALTNATDVNGINVFCRGGHYRNPDR